jgi:ATP-dependent RNA helicase SUPV3L1/SUV3
MGARIAGFRGFGPQMLRIDMAERMARTAHEAIAKGEAFTPLRPEIVSLGLSEPAFLELMRASGFRPLANAAEGAPNWAFRGRQKARPPREAPRAPNARPTPAAPATANAFSGLADLLGRNG